MITSLKNKILGNSFLKQSLITLILRVIGIFTLFGFTLFITNYYSENIVGEYETIRTFLLVIGSVVLLGTEQSILFYAGKYQALDDLHGLKKVYFKMLQILIISSVTLSVLFILIPKSFILSFLNDDFIAFSNIKKSFYILFFYVVTLFNTEVLRALNYIYISEIFRNILKYLPVFVGALLLMLFGDPYWLVDFYLYGFVFLSAITFLMVYKSFKKGKTETVHPTTKAIFTQSYPMALSSLCFFLMLSFDVFLLKKYYSNQEVAFYAVAVKLFNILSMIIIAVNINVAPKLAQFYATKDFDKLIEILKKSKKMIFISNLIIGSILIVFGKFILNLFGSNYVNSYFPMLILVIGQMMVSFFGSTSALLNMSNKQHLFKNILISATLLNLILNVILIPKYGMIGAAISFVISSLFWNCISVYYVKYKLLPK